MLSGGPPTWLTFSSEIGPTATIPSEIFTADLADEGTYYEVFGVKSNFGPVEAYFTIEFVINHPCVNTIISIDPIDDISVSSM